MTGCDTSCAAPEVLGMRADSLELVVMVGLVAAFILGLAIARQRPKPDAGAGGDARR